MIQEFFNALKRVHKQQKVFLLAGALELVFISGFLFVLAWILGKVYPILTDLSRMTEALQFAGGLENQESAYTALATSVQFASQYRQLLFWAVLGVALLFLIFLLSQIALFYLSEILMGRKQKFWPYARRMSFIIGGAWMLIIGTAIAISWLSFLNAKLPFPIFADPFLKTVLALSCAVAVLCASVAVARIPQKKTFSIVLKNFVQVMTSWLQTLILSAFGLIVIYLFFKVGTAVLGALSSLPLLIMRLLFGVLALYFASLGLCLGLFLVSLKLFLLSRLRF